MRKLVGVRHKEHAYLTKEHPMYEVTSEEVGLLTKVSEIHSVTNASGVAQWISIIFYLSHNMIGDLRVRVEECDQFMYIEEDKGE